MQLKGSLVRAERLTAEQRDRMCQLMTASFDSFERSGFDADLAEKRWAILLTNGDDRIVGFSTQMPMEVRAEGRRVRALFSGDTVVEPAYWGQTELVRLWGRLALRLLDQAGADPLYWFLISMGYKTYRFLPIFFHEFYPRCDAPTPPRQQAVLDALGRAKFPDTYDPATGVIRPNDSNCRLRPGVADIDARRLEDPRVRFFATRNPGHAQGHELACIAPITRANFKPRAYTIFGRPDPVVAMEL